MFNLLMVMMAIALAAATTLAAYFYGGPMFSKGNDRAQAEGALEQARQITTAVENSVRYGEGVPESLDELVDNGFLRAMPGGSESPWSIDDGVLSRPPPSNPVCRHINVMAGATDTLDDPIPDCESMQAAMDNDELSAAYYCCQ